MAPARAVFARRNRRRQREDMSRMHIHILGICGTFMGGIAAIASRAGFKVTGCDANVYPPMSTQLEALGIGLTEGYDAAQLEGVARGAGVFVIGNALSRGNPLVEEILDKGLAYQSGPQWLFEHVLKDKWVLAVAGTHGKTTVTSMLAWILDWAEIDPGFLIGGVPTNFGISARLTDSDFFVIEADEYDTAFFDKRSKFVHYRPRTAILNNLEFDHADIFPDLAAIETQFHHLVRSVPRSGALIVNAEAPALERVLKRGAWSKVERFAGAESIATGTDAAHASSLLAHWLVDEHGVVTDRGTTQGGVRWPEGRPQLGRHNRLNALAAIVAARHVGVPPSVSIQALARFEGIKRRLETRGVAGGVTVYDDFAHHPTAIATTVDGLRRAVGKDRILAVLEPRSNTMKLGAVKDALPGSLAGADMTFCYAGKLGWDPAAALAPLGAKASVFGDLDVLIDAVVEEAHTGDHVLVMSNGGFGGIHDKLLQRLASRGA
jgi:UDP-N-acetylmuramate: L-alanyl-gamma-D-glutamyl-meso-diaminopimelate ligase